MPVRRTVEIEPATYKLYDKSLSVTVGRRTRFVYLQRQPEDKDIEVCEALIQMGIDHQKEKTAETLRSLL